MVALAGYILSPYWLGWLWHPPLKKIATEQLETGKRTLIVAPHPDDETLAPSGLIQKELKAGNKIKVVIMTSGDSYKKAIKENYKVVVPKPIDYRRMGEDRHQESLNALGVLGAAAQDVDFLGYPDRGLSNLWEYNWDNHQLYRGLNGATNSPYHFAFEKYAPYSGTNVVKNLTEIIKEFKPTDVVYPNPNDEQPDHWATNTFVKYTLTKEHYRGKELTYLVHRGDYPWPWIYEANLPLLMPGELKNMDFKWSTLPLDSIEINNKTRAVFEYHTQVKVLELLLYSFIRKNELFGIYTDPVLPRAAKRPDLGGGKQLSYMVFKDPVEDSVLHRLQGNADLTAVGAVQEAGRLHIGLETREPASPEVSYNIRIRIFRPDKADRLVLTVHQRRVDIKEITDGIGLQPEYADLKMQDKQLWVTIPAKVIAGAEGIFISADTFVNRKEVDKTAWRLVRLNSRGTI